MKGLKHISYHWSHQAATELMEYSYNPFWPGDLQEVNHSCGHTPRSQLPSDRQRFSLSGAGSRCRPGRWYKKKRDENNIKMGKKGAGPSGQTYNNCPRNWVMTMTKLLTEKKISSWPGRIIYLVHQRFGNMMCWHPGNTALIKTKGTFNFGHNYRLPTWTAKHENYRC